MIQNYCQLRPGGTHLVTQVVQEVDAGGLQVEEQTGQLTLFLKIKVKRTGDICIFLSG